MVNLVLVPNSGPPGSSVVIRLSPSGQNLPIIIVLVNGVRTTFRTLDSNTLLVRIPTTAAVGSTIVVTVIRSAPCAKLLVGASATFTVTSPPTPSPTPDPFTINQVRGPGGITGPFNVGTTITVTGTGFQEGVSVNLVDSNGLPIVVPASAVTIVNSTTLTFVLPDNTSAEIPTTTLSLTLNGETTDTRNINVRINLVSAAVSGTTPGSTTVTITATNFPAQLVSFIIRDTMGNIVANSGLVAPISSTQAIATFVGSIPAGTYTIEANITDGITDLTSNRVPLTVP